MESRKEESHSTPIKNEQKGERHGPTQKHIQINLSKEYFASLVNSDDIAFESERKMEFPLYPDEAPSNKDMEGHIDKESDNESGITPIIHDESPLKGIMKLNSSESPRKEEEPYSPIKMTSSPGSKSPKSQKKVRITEPGKRSTSKTAQSITEIEGIRTQLKHMIELTKLHSTSETPHGKIQGILPEEHHENQGDTSKVYEARKSFDSMTSLRELLTHTSPPLLMDEHGIMRGPEMQQVPHVERSTNEYVSPQTDRSLTIENSILKENLEREKQRRKHCEIQIQNLQKKVLEMQQQLAVAVATDRKKAIMIEQLDKTLANIVAGWKKQDSEKIKTIQKVRDENSILRKSQNKQQELLEQFEKELAQAVESLTKEQARTKAAEREKQDEIQRYQVLREEAYKKLQNEQDALQKLNQDREQLVTEKSELNKQLNDLEEQVEEDRSSWIKERQDLTKAAKDVEERFQEEIEKLKETVSSAKSKLQTSNAKASTLENDVKNLHIDLETALREKESLKVEVTLLETKIDTIQVKQESEQRALLEEEFNKKINIIQDEVMRTETQLKNAHKDQIFELNKRHKEDLELQLKRFHEEINKRENQTEMLKRDFETRLSEAEDEINELRDSKAKLEAQRKELTRRLQSLMQQHIQEAVSLVSVAGGLQTPSAHHITEAVGHYGFKDNLMMHSLYNEKPMNYSPLSSTVTEPKEVAKLRDSISSIHSKDYLPTSGMGRFYGDSSKMSQNMPDSASLTSLFESKTNSKSVPFNQISGVTAEQRDLVDSLYLREQQFQSGLQSLSDKLRLTRNDFDRGQETLEQKPALHDGNRRHWIKEEVHEPVDNWHQIQQLLQHRLDEVTQGDERLIQTDPGSQGEPADYNTGSGLFDTLNKGEPEAQETRQTKLTSLIKKLLNRSPGNPTEDEDERENSAVLKQVNEIRNTRRVDRDLPVTLSDLTNQVKAKQFESLPIGSDSVSQDLMKGVLKTPPRAPPTSHVAHAFKKSVLKERPVKPGYFSSADEAHSARKSPQKVVGVASHGSNSEPQNLQSFLKALGVEKGTSGKNLEEVIKMLSAFQASQSQKRQVVKHSTEHPDAVRPSRSSSATQRPKSNSQWHQKHHERSQVDEIFSQLQKIYGHSEGSHSEKPPSADAETKISSKSAAPSKRQSHPATKQGKLKQQRKTIAAARQTVSAWK